MLNANKYSKITFTEGAATLQNVKVACSCNMVMDDQTYVGLLLDKVIPL